MKIRLRTPLFTPATRPERFAKATEVNADLLIIDLEDGVAPRDKKDARHTALAWLKESSESSTPSALRINGLDTAEGLADIIALLESEAQPDFVVLPKVDSAAHLQLLDRLLTKGNNHSRLIGLIESAAALDQLDQIAQSTPRLQALMLGAADLAADLGSGPYSPNLQQARVQLIAACARAKIDALDSPFFDIKNGPALRRAAKDGADMGFAGQAAIHPSQVEPINSAFSPTADEITNAREILLENRKGVGMVNGAMVDEAVARKARRTLTQAGENIDI